MLQRRISYVRNRPEAPFKKKKVCGIFTDSENSENAAVDHEIVKGWSGSESAPHRSLGYPCYWTSFIISTLCTKDLLPISKMS